MACQKIASYNSYMRVFINAQIRHIRIIQGKSKVSQNKTITNNPWINDKSDFDHLFMYNSRPITCICDINCWQNSRFVASYVS